jgi:hypothetical protein
VVFLSLDDLRRTEEVITKEAQRTQRRRSGDVLGQPVINVRTEDVMALQRQSRPRRRLKLEVGQQMSNLDQLGLSSIVTIDLVLKTIVGQLGKQEIAEFFRSHCQS